MKSVVAKLLNKLTYLNVILTIIAILLAVQLTHNLGLTDARRAHARDITSVRIESVAGNIPVAIKAPVTTKYPAGVCVNYCKFANSE